MDRHRGVAKQGVEPDALGRGRVEAGERERVGTRGDDPEEHQPGEEHRQARQHGGRPRHQLPQPVASQPEDPGGSEREHPGPQQQRARLARPHRGELVAGGRRGRGVVGDQLDREVVAQEGDLQAQHADREQPGHRVEREPSRLGVAPIPMAAGERRPAGVERAEEGAAEAGGAQGRDHCSSITTCSGSASASSANFDGHLVIRLSRSATRTPPSSSPVMITSRPSRKGSGTVPL